jgi:hypothetical protein
VLLALAAGLAACGGGQRQDATEPSGNFAVKVTRSSFPNRQHISKTTDLVLAIKNVGDKTVPDLAVTIFTSAEGSRGSAITPPEPGSGEPDGSFEIRLKDPSLANPSRPVWVLENQYPKILEPGLTKKDLEQAPTAGATAAQTDTFQFGQLKPGESKAIDWRLTPARTGNYTVRYEVAAGLQGKAKAVTADGSAVKGEFVVAIAGRPPQTCVTGSGKVVQGSCQLHGTGG